MLDADLGGRFISRVDGVGQRVSGQIFREKLAAVDKNVEVAGPRDIDLADYRDLIEVRAERFRDGPRILLFAGRLFDQFGELKRGGKGKIAKFGLRRRLDDDLAEIDPKFLARGGA